MYDNGLPSALPDILNILLIFPPEPIKERFGRSSLLFFTHFFTSFQIFSSTLLFISLTVPSGKDLELINFPSEKKVNSVLPPPTSTYKYDLSL